MFELFKLDAWAKFFVACHLYHRLPVVNCGERTWKSCENPARNIHNIRSFCKHESIFVQRQTQTSTLNAHFVHIFPNLLRAHFSKLCPQFDQHLKENRSFTAEDCKSTRTTASRSLELRRFYFNRNTKGPWTQRKHLILGLFSPDDPEGSDVPLQVQQRV